MPPFPSSSDAAPGSVPPAVPVAVPATPVVPGQPISIPVTVPVTVPVAMPAETPPVTAPVAASTGSSPLDDDVEADERELAALSPMNVLKKRSLGTSAPASPPPAIPVTTPVAASVTAPVAAPAPAGPPLIVPGHPAVSPGIVPATSALRPQAVPRGVPTTPVSAAVPPRHRPSIGLIAGVGLFVALVVLSGGGYVLALGGSRLPIFYSLASGLSPDGLAVAGKAATYVGGKQSYLENGSTAIVGGEVSGSTLPGNTGSASNSIGTIKTAITAANPLRYDLKAAGLSGKLGLTIDTAAELPIYLNTKATGFDGKWLVNLPANTGNPLVSVKADGIPKSLLFPALQPAPLTQLLAAVTKETSYQKMAGQQVAYYSYNLDGGKLAVSLPAGATVATATLGIYYQWQTAQPLHTDLSIKFSYQQRSYQLTEAYDYKSWDAALPAATSDTNLAAVLTPSTVNVPQQVEATGFIPQLGILLTNIPSTYDLSTVVIVPTGEGVTKAGSAITAVPPLPVVPATTAGIQRDTQRQADLNDLQKALEAYKTKTGAYPKVTGVVQTGASADLITAMVPTYMSKLPVDPLKDTYWYEYSSDGTAYALHAFAEDATNAQAKKGKAFAYFEVTNQTAPVAVATPVPAAKATPTPTPTPTAQPTDLPTDSPTDTSSTDSSEPYSGF